jgi:uncharacterized protein YdhG (YjbR/CyaY superfamily)
MAMKKAKAGKSRPTAKSSAAPKTVEEYIAGLPEPGGSRLKRVRALIRSVVPAEATEVISYGIPAFRYKGMLVWYAAFATHWSLFPGASVIEAFKKELKDFPTSKGTIRFSLDDPLPATLVKKMVKTRVAEKDGKKRS